MSSDSKTYHREYMRRYRESKEGFREIERNRAKEYRKRTQNHKLYYEENKENWIRYRIEQRKRHPEAAAKYSASYRQRHGADYIHALARNQYVTRRAHYILKAIRYRIRKKGAQGISTHEQRLFRVEFHGWKCRYCGRKLTAHTLTIDHMIPLSRGGTDWPANLVPACKPCNSSKHSKTYKEFLRYS